jgi:cell cycle arrest protein BFA1
MNGIPRKLKTVKVSTPSPGLSGNGQLTKSEFLRRYEEADDLSDDDDIFGQVEDDLDEEFQTLKLNSDDIDTLPKSFKYKPILLPARGGMVDLEFSPIDSISTSSPKLSVLASNRYHSVSTSTYARPVTRKSLSEYSEGDETDVTSQLNDDEFEDMDNLFGAGEAGIYNKMNQKLKSKQAELQANAEREERELQNRLHSIQQQKKLMNNDTCATLKLKDFNQFNKSLTHQNISFHNQLDNDNTIDFEYTKDEFEDFEQGFDNNFENKMLNSTNNQLKRFYSSSKLNPKMQRPPSSQFATMKKYKSTMDVGGLSKHPVGEIADPGFNFDNRVKSRLERIPSFYHKATRESDQEKREYLNKFQEQKLIDKETRRKRNNETPSKVGTVRYLNNNSVMNAPKIPTSIIMKYNPATRTWEGNEIDLLRFENFQKPSLITLNDVKDSIPSMRQKNSRLGYNNKETNSHMVFDVENLRWINTNEDNESIFNEIADLEDVAPTKPLQYSLSSPPILSLKPTALNNEFHSPITGRGPSQFTQRTTSTNTVSTSSENSHEVDEFILSDKLMERFLKEEMKLSKKINHWFRVDETYDFSPDGSNRDYYWEIRNMIMETEE